MTVAATTRKAGPYEGNGTTKEFTFPFKVFSAEDLFVAKSSDDGEVQLVYGTDYTVRLNSDQDTTPGGAVVLSSALADGVYLSVISQMSYDQLAIFTNKGGFYPETLNKCYDKLTILVQQLLEELSRSIKVDITDTMSASELKEKLLDAADQATVIAKQYAEQAIASASSAQASAQKAEDAVEGLEDKESALEGKLEDFTDTQIARIEDVADMDFVLNATGCAEKQWTLTSNVSAGTAITIPSELYYIVGRHHLRVSYNGLVCYIGENFTEVGNTDTKSNQFKLTFDAKSGDELDVWIAALGKADVADAIATATAANDAVAELSQKVVYKDADSAGS